MKLIRNLPCAPQVKDSPWGEGKQHRRKIANRGNSEHSSRSRSSKVAFWPIGKWAGGEVK